MSCNGNANDLPMAANGLPMAANGLPMAANGRQWQEMGGKDRQDRHSHMTWKSIYSPVSSRRKYKLFLPGELLHNPVSRIPHKLFYQANYFTPCSHLEPW